MDFSQGDGFGMAASASQSHAFPAAVAAVLKSHSGAEGAVDGGTGLAWVFSKKELLVWMYDEGPDAEVHNRTLPYTSSRRHFVSFALHEVRGRDACSVCFTFCCMMQTAWLLTVLGPVGIH